MAHLPPLGIRMAQALLPTDVGADAESLVAAGFRHVSDLLYLVCLADQFPASPPCRDLQFEPYSPALDARFADLVDATYEDTLDCPAVNGVRRIDDVLQGYRATGQFDPERWLMVRHQGEPVGCLILTAYPEHATWELIYMGILPAVRGRGWGVEIVRHAQWLARQAEPKRLVLAVDAANEPALRMYAAAGFQAWDRRSVFVRILGEEDHLTTCER
jgi:ribosomal protein S18 acetylase RimI-like enzyme